MEDISKYIENSTVNIRHAVKAMDSGGKGFIIIVNENERVIGILTDGDFRRAILNGISLHENVMKIANKNFKFIEYGTSENQIIEIFKNSVILHLPVLDEGKLIDVLFRKDFNLDYKSVKYPQLNLSVVIMAGGKGTRLAPFTDILPKPLIPIGDKTIIEVIMDEYALFGIKDFYISLNYKAKLIKAYFEDSDLPFKISYIDEKKPLGTGGALKYLENKIGNAFFVSNCDIIIKDNYSKIVDFHYQGNFDLTLVGSMQHHIMPYGICEINKDGSLKKINEKPEYDFLVNTGMYLVEPRILKYIPEDSFFNMTDLITVLHNNNMKVGVYPVSNNSWIDIGQWEEYKNAVEKLKIR
jgi:dTDP-glucose pyrophosphorylase